mmetsp:Transcript_58697/g.108273  ORF Transcript_58697/g.108273 Transcript_58697/m.108273 type:complete len:314 (+) Transcript_58697:765-1706(+)
MPPSKYPLVSSATCADQICSPANFLWRRPHTNAHLAHDHQRCHRVQCSPRPTRCALPPGSHPDWAQSCPCAYREYTRRPLRSSKLSQQRCLGSTRPIWLQSPLGLQVHTALAQQTPRIAQFLHLRAVDVMPSGSASFWIELPLDPFQAFHRLASPSLPALHHQPWPPRVSCLGWQPQSQVVMYLARSRTDHPWLSVQARSSTRMVEQTRSCRSLKVMYPSASLACYYPHLVCEWAHRVAKRDGQQRTWLSPFAGPLQSPFSAVCSAVATEFAGLQLGDAPSPCLHGPRLLAFVAVEQGSGICITFPAIANSQL